MDKHKIIELRNEPKEDKVTVGSAELQRTTTIETGGNLQQDLSVSYNGEILGGALWTFKPDGTSDLHLDALDHRWQNLQWEFKIMMEQANFYNHIKGRDDDSDSNPLLPQFLTEIAHPLLAKPMSDENFAAGGGDAKVGPVTTDADRFTALRNAAAHTDGIELDKFEMSIMALNDTLYQAMGVYSKGIGEDEGHDHEHDELQFTAGQDEDDDSHDDEDHDEKAEAWRGDQHPEVKDQFGDDDKEERESWRGDGEPEEGKLSFLMTDYAVYVSDFANAANRVWMAAAERIYHNKPVTQDAYTMPLHNMQLSIKQSERAYKKLKSASQEAMGENNYELRPAFELLEDEKKGAIIRMQKMMDMASKPAQLEAIIKKSMNKQRDGRKDLGI